MATVGTLALNLVAKTEKFMQGMDAARRRVRKFQRRMSLITGPIKAVGRALLGLAKTALRVATALAVTGVGLTAFFVKAAADAEEVEGKFRTVFRGIAKETAAWADAWSDAMGQVRVDTKRWLSGLQDVFVPLGMAREEAAEMAKQITVLAADLGSFNNVATDDVIRDLTSAIVGNHETVRKYGIMIDVATLQQFAYANGIAKVGKALTNMQKVQARVGLFMANSADATGDLERTMGSLTNTLRRIGARWENLRKQIGDVIKLDVARWLTKLDEWVGRNADSVRDFATAIWQDLVPRLETLGTWAVDMTGKLEGLSAGFTAAADAAAALYKEISKPLFTRTGHGLIDVVEAGLDKARGAFGSLFTSVAGGGRRAPNLLSAGLGLITGGKFGQGKPLSAGPALAPGPATVKGAVKVTPRELAAARMAADAELEKLLGAPRGIMGLWVKALRPGAQVAPAAVGPRAAPGAVRAGSAGAAAFRAEQFYRERNTAAEQTAENTEVVAEAMPTLPVAIGQQVAKALAVASVTTF